jgi:hypothetical protein
MWRQEIQFPGNRSLCVLPEDCIHLRQALTELGLGGVRPVIVLIGGYIPEENTKATQKAIESIAAYAEENNILIICGGTVVGIMGSIGSTRLAHGYQFPLLGITLKDLASWPKGPRSKRFLWWGRERWPLSTGYSHFILVPGDRFGEDSPWLADAATNLSQGSRSVTVLANGGSVARKDIGLSLECNRPIIILAGTGRLADEMAVQPDRSALIMSVQAEDEITLQKTLQSLLQIKREGARGR